MNPTGAQQPIVDNLPLAARAPELQKIRVVGLQVAIEPKRIVALRLGRHAMRFPPVVPFAKGPSLHSSLVFIYSKQFSPDPGLSLPTASGLSVRIL